MPAATAAEGLYERHGRKIFAFCFHRLGNREEAEDAVQTTFLNAFRSLQRGVEPEIEVAWLFKIAENVCLSRLRSSSRRRRLEAPADLHALQDVVPSRPRETDELFGLNEALGAMPAQQRRALLLREWHGLSYAEIASELELSQSAVETLLFRARRSLARGLEQPPAPDQASGRLRSRAGELGSALTALKALFFGSSAKIAATLATVAATSVAVTPPARHQLEHAVTGGPASSTAVATPVARPAAHVAPLVVATPAIRPSTEHMAAVASTLPPPRVVRDPMPLLGDRAVASSSPGKAASVTPERASRSVRPAAIAGAPTVAVAASAPEVVTSPKHDRPVTTAERGRGPELRAASAAHVNVERGEKAVHARTTEKATKLAGRKAADVAPRATASGSKRVTHAKEHAVKAETKRHARPTVVPAASAEPVVSSGQPEAVAKDRANGRDKQHQAETVDATLAPSDSTTAVVDPQPAEAVPPGKARA